MGSEERRLAETKTLLKITQEKLPASQIGLEIEVPAELSRQIYDRVVNDFVRSADIPGFRKGKVPRQVVLQRIGQARLKAAAVEELVQNGLQQAIDQEKLAVLGNFQLNSDFEQLVSQYQPGAPLTFSAKVDVSPEVKLGDYKNLAVTAQAVEYDPTKAEAVLAEHQQERATLIPVEERPAQLGDVVQVDFAGRLVPDEDKAAEGEAESTDAQETANDILGGEAKDFQLELTPGRFIPGFIEGVIGMAPGETKEIPVTFPEDYFQEELSGQEAVFTVTLSDIKEKELPSLDDEFAQEISEFKTLAELQQFLEGRYQKEAEQQTQANINEAILAELLRTLEVDLPETLVNNEVNFLLTQMATRLQSQGIDVNQLLTDELIPKLREQARPEAEVRIKRSLSLAEVAKQEAIQVDPKQVEERYQALLEQLSGRKIDRDRLRSVVTEELLEEKVLQWLKDHAQIELTQAAESTDASESSAAADPEEAIAVDAVVDQSPETEPSES